MSKIYKSLSELIGKTPLLELTNYEKENGLSATILAKLEYFNPAGSVKDRIAKGIIEDAEKKKVFSKKGRHDNRAHKRKYGYRNFLGCCGKRL